MSRIELRPARMPDARSILEVMRAACAALPDPSLYLADDLPFVEDRMREGVSYVACDGDRVVAFLLMRAPGDAPDNLAQWLDLPAAERARVIYMDSVAVLPSHRGQGLQRRLLALGERELSGTRFRWAIATVSPDNAHSAANFKALGYRKAAMVRKDCGWLRDLWVKELAGCRSQ